ncbi:unnamed protein product, partial [Tenebrio molitor]
QCQKNDGLNLKEKIDVISSTQNNSLSFQDIEKRRCGFQTLQILLQSGEEGRKIDESVLVWCWK